MWQSGHIDEIMGYSFPDPHRSSRSIIRYAIGLGVILVSVIVGLAMLALLGIGIGLFET
jgi:hypothetical protein